MGNTSTPKEIQQNIILDYKNGIKPSDILNKYKISKRMMRRLLKAESVITQKLSKDSNINNNINSIISDLENLPIYDVATKYKTTSRHIKKIIEKQNIIILKPEVKHFINSRGFIECIDWVKEHKDWDKFIFVAKLKRRGKQWNWSTEQYKEFIDYVYYDERFNTIYDKWKSTGNKWFKPSLDHKTPLSRGGSNELHNFKIITWFENQTKLAKTQDEWDIIKENIQEYFI